MTDLSMPWDPPDGKPLRDRVGGQQAIRLGGSDRDPGREELDQLSPQRRCAPGACRCGKKPTR